MIVFGWNIRELNSLSRQRFLRAWMAKNKPVIGGVLETHVSEENAQQVFNRAFPGWRGEMNYEYAENGRIWVVWDPAVSVICLYKSAQIMLCGVYVPATKENFSVAFVYAYNTQGQRRELWQDIQNISQTSPARFSPMMVVGDFNQIVYASEHYSVQPHGLPLAGMSDLHDCIVDSELSDLPFRGAFFTWYNERLEDPIMRKLDRVLVNDHWRDSFPDSLSVFDPPGDSDHSPCLVYSSAVVERSNKAFKYFSFLSTHRKFKDVIIEAWQVEVGVGSKLFVLAQRM